MTKEQLRKDQVTIANGCNNDYNRVQRLNPIPKCLFDWRITSNIQMATRKLSVAPYDYTGETIEARFYYTIFDFENIHDSMKTSAFETDMSWN